MWERIFEVYFITFHHLCGKHIQASLIFSQEERSGHPDSQGGIGYFMLQTGLLFTTLCAAKV